MTTVWGIHLWLDFDFSMDSNSGDGVDDNSLGDSFMILNEA